MAAEQRKLLGRLLPKSCLMHANDSVEQLMGVGASSRSSTLTLTDPKVCRSFIVGTCPHDLFTNTKQDLGTCPKVHSENLKSDYEADKDKARLGFEYDYMRDLQKYIDECNRRIDSAQRRLEKTQEEIAQTDRLVGLFRIQVVIRVDANRCNS
jgi:LUC7 N_terminus